MKNKTLIIATIAGVVGLSALGAVTFANDVAEEKGQGMTGRMMHHGERGPRGGQGMFGGGQERNTAVQSAIENNDYDAYLTAVQAVFTEHSSEAFFNDLVVKRSSAENIKAAFEAEDYDAYIEAVQGTEREGKLTQEQFADMISHKAERMSGEKGEGLKERMKKTFQEDGSKPSRSNLQSAVMEGDYDAFVAAIAGTALEGKISQSQFDSVVAKFKK